MNPRLLLSAAAPATALPGAALVAPPVEARTFEFANPGDALSMDPHSLNESLPLVGRGKKLELVPAPAWAGKRNVDTVQLADNYMFLKWTVVK